MRLRQLSVLGLASFPAAATAGGLLLPGAGPISTSRAGAAVVSADDGEAISINPAGMAKTTGTTITVGASFIGFFMDFHRAGNYDAIADEDRPYEGTRYPKMTNDPDLDLGIGKFQPIPTIAVVSDLGGKLPGFRLGFSLYAPNAYPFRDLTGGYEFNGDFDQAPPTARYDIMKQKAAIILPSLAASYSITPDLDVGLRYSQGWADLESTVTVWGSPGNYEEAVTHDAQFTAKASAGSLNPFAKSAVKTWSVGALYRPMPALELGFNYNWRVVVNSKGDATNVAGPKVSFNMNPAVIGAVAAGAARCAEGGNFDVQKVCVDFQLPMSAQVGGRYKFLDDKGAMKGDVELNVGWENWGKRCADSADFADGCTSPTTYRVVVDAAAFIDVDQDGMIEEEERQIDLKDNYVEHRFKDTWNFRLGGSYVIPVGTAESGNSVVVRGGLGYDTQAAEEGWLRADVDGAARVTTTIGGSYRTKKWQASLGFGAILEGENSNSPDCNPIPSGANTRPGCGAGGVERPIEDRQGPDPINPIVNPDQQAESPVNRGTFTSNYILFMMGFTTWF